MATCPVGHSFAAAYDVTAGSVLPTSMDVGVCVSDWGGNPVFGNAGNLTMAQDLHAGGIRWIRWDAGNSISNLKTYWLNAYADYKACLAFAGDTNGSYANGVAAINATTWANWALGIWQNNGLTKDRVPAIEVLNEPYGSWFWGAGANSSTNAVAYGALVKQVYTTFHAALGANSPKILAYTFGWNGYDDPSGTPAWWTSLVAAHPDIANYYDAVIVHPYGAGTPYGKATGAAGCRPAVTSAVSTTGKSVWITEYGWRDGKQTPNNIADDTTGYQFTDAEVAANITNFNAWCRSTGDVAATFLYEYVDEASPSFWGIAYRDNPAGANFVHKTGSYAALMGATTVAGINVADAITVRDTPTVWLSARKVAVTETVRVLDEPSTACPVGRSLYMPYAMAGGVGTPAITAVESIAVRDSTAVRPVAVGALQLGPRTQLSPTTRLGETATGLLRLGPSTRLSPTTHLGELSAQVLVAVVESVRATDVGSVSASVRLVQALESVAVLEVVNIPRAAQAFESVTAVDAAQWFIPTGVRSLGSIVVSVRVVVRPIDRVTVSDTARVRFLAFPAALAHARAMGIPALSARATPPGLTRTRVLVGPSVNARTLALVALDRI